MAILNEICSTTFGGGGARVETAARSTSLLLRLEAELNWINWTGFALSKGKLAALLGGVVPFEFFVTKAS